MSGTKIIAANGKPIKAGNRALKQNYMFGMGITKLFKIELNLPSNISNWSIFQLTVKIGEHAVIPSSDASLAHAYSVNWKLSNNTSPILYARVRGTSFTRGKVGYISTEGSGDNVYPQLIYETGQSDEAATTIIAQAYKAVEPYFLCKNNDNLIHKIKGGIKSAVGETITDPVISGLSSINKIELNYNIPSPGDADNVAMTRLVIFDRQLTQRERVFLYNNGNSNQLLSKVGLLSEINFSEAEIINISDTDFVAFRDSSGNNVHAKITSGLPVGSLEEQKDFVNSKLKKWLY